MEDLLFKNMHPKYQPVKSTCVIFIAAILKVVCNILSKQKLGESNGTQRKAMEDNSSMHFKCCVGKKALKIADLLCHSRG